MSLLTKTTLSQIVRPIYIVGDTNLHMVVSIHVTFLGIPINKCLSYCVYKLLWWTARKRYVSP